MYISKISYDMPNAYEYLNSDITSYAVHQDMWEFFPGMKDLKVGPFIYCVQNETICMVSSFRPAVPNNLWKIQTRTYNPLVNEGQELLFEIKISPSYAKDSVKQLYLCSKLKPRGESEKTKDEQEHELMMHWFKKREERLGFSVTDLNIVKSCVKKIPKPDNLHPVGKVHITGTLTVKNVQFFTDALFKGIGRNKREGYGLLLVT